MLILRLALPRSQLSTSERNEANLVKVNVILPYLSPASIRFDPNLAV